MKFGTINMRLRIFSPKNGCQCSTECLGILVRTGRYGFAGLRKNGLPDIEFKMHESGLHYWDPTNDTTKTGPNTKTKLTFVETVEDRKKLYSKRQVKLVEVARASLHNAGFSPEQDFRLMVQNGHISNCPIQINVVDQAKHIHGKDVRLLKGQTTRNKPLPVIENIVPVPKEILNLHYDVFLTVVLFYVNKIVFLVAHSRRICLTTLKWLDTRIITGVFAALREVFKRISKTWFSCCRITIFS
jgi:hypothetical protein